MNKRLTTEQKRAALKLAYADRDWIDKIDKMPNLQVYAIYDHLCKIGMIYFDEKGNIFFRSKEEVQELKEKRLGVHQMTIDEWLQEKEKK